MGIGFLCFLLVVAVMAGRTAFGLWRMNLAVNHPEQYERLREYEREQHAMIRATYELALPVIKKTGEAAGRGGALIAAMLTKKK